MSYNFIPVYNNTSSSSFKIKSIDKIHINYLNLDHIFSLNDVNLIASEIYINLIRILDKFAPTLKKTKVQKCKGKYPFINNDIVKNAKLIRDKAFKDFMKNQDKN